MASTTPNLGLHKSAGSEFVNVTEDLNNNWDTVDTEIGKIGDGGKWESDSTQNIDAYTPTNLFTNVGALEVWTRGSAVSITGTDSDQFSINRIGIWLVTIEAEFADIPEDQSRPDDSKTVLVLKDVGNDVNLDSLALPSEADGFKIAQSNFYEFSSTLNIAVEGSTQTENADPRVIYASISAVWIRP